jgi:hypothetical protein
MVMHGAFAGLFRRFISSLRAPAAALERAVEPGQLPPVSPPRKVSRVNGVKFLANNVIDWPSFRRRTP